jgi:lipoprotein NlpI
MNQRYQVIFKLGVLTMLSNLLLPCSFAFKSNALDLPSSKPGTSGSSLQEQDWATTWLSRGIAKALGGDYHAAIASYNQALHLDSKNSDTYYNRGVAYYSLGQHQRALTDFSQSIKLNPSLAEPGYLTKLQKMGSVNCENAITTKLLAVLSDDPNKNRV